jgi:hypothetical protein
VRLVGLAHRVRERLRPLRRRTALGPFLDALALHAILRRIADPRHSRVLGPDELAPYIRELTALSPHHPLPFDLPFDAIVVRQDHMNALPVRLLVALRERYTGVYMNRRFLLFVPSDGAIRGGNSDAAAIAERLAALTQAAAPAPGLSRRDDQQRAVLVTTFNRPAALERSLPQITALGSAVLVVDDGSSPPAADRNRRLCAACGARYLHLPDNRGLSGALNVGLSYLLADTRLEWISYLQDDVDVDPALLTHLRDVEDAVDRPLITGYDADEHPCEREERRADTIIRWKRSSPAVHLHGHVSYWRGVLPIPTEYLGAPRRRWDASLEDYWIVNNAPASAGARGLLVACLPGLVRTFLWHQADSTWDNPNLPDPPLASTDLR